MYHRYRAQRAPLSPVVTEVFRRPSCLVVCQNNYHNMIGTQLTPRMRAKRISTPASLKPQNELQKSLE